MLRTLLVATVLTVACSKEHSAARDAAVVGELDAPLSDATLIDAPLDTSADAAPPAASTCASTVSVLADLAPSRVFQIVRAGDTLYIAAGDYDQGTDGFTNTRVVPYDLTTGTPAGTPIAFQSLPGLWPGDGEAWVSDYAAGSIWRLRPGMSPEQVVTGRPTLGVVTADGGYVYWSEAVPPSNEQTVIRRRLISGGTVEPVTTCDSPSELIVYGNDLYWPEFLHRVKRAPKAGGTSVEITSLDTYPIPSMARQGADLFFVTLKPTAEVVRVQTPNGPDVLVKEMTTVARFSGIAVSPSFIYLTAELGVRRIHRATNLFETSYNGICAQDPVLWNNQLVFVQQDSQVLRCVD